MFSLVIGTTRRVHLSVGDERRFVEWLPIVMIVDGADSSSDEVIGGVRWRYLSDDNCAEVVIAKEHVVAFTKWCRDRLIELTSKGTAGHSYVIYGVPIKSWSLWEQVTI